MHTLSMGCCLSSGWNRYSVPKNRIVPTTLRSLPHSSTATLATCRCLIDASLSIPGLALYQNGVVGRAVVQTRASKVFLAGVCALPECSSSCVCVCVCVCGSSDEGEEQPPKTLAELLGRAGLSTWAATLEEEV